MPPRSVLVFALLLAALAAAQWTDVLYSSVINATAKKICAVDSPDTCIFAPVLHSSIDIRTTYAVAVFYDRATWRWYSTPVLSPHTIVTREPIINITIYTPEGYILAPESVKVNGMTPDITPLCGMNLSAVRVTAGMQRITGNLYYPCGSFACYEPVRFLNASNCGAFTLIEHIYRLGNVTIGWAYVYILHMPTARQVLQDPYNEILNGTAHAYFAHVRETPPAGDGYYIVNRVRVPAVAVMRPRWSVYVGPKAFDMLEAAVVWDYYNPKFIIYTIGQHPGDGVVAVGVPFFMTISAPAELVIITDGTAAYFVVRDIPTDIDPVHVFIRRYGIAELALSDGIFTYTTRTIACPPYRDSTHRRVFTIPARANAAREIEVCNNKTSTVYLALSVTHSIHEYLTFIDRVEPGKCARLRWDGLFRASDTKLYIYPSAQEVCRGQHEAVKLGGQDYITGWLYYLMPDNSLVRVSPIDPDTLYAEIWKQIMQNLALQYNETKNALQQWLQTQADAAKRIEDYYRSLPQYQGTIQMSSSTSVWLRTVLEAISRYTVPGMPPAGAGVAPTPLPSAASAAAAAAAVATAWAASRRSLATAAFLAGFAILASALFVYYIYGVSVTGGLILAAVVLMSIGAAAAWFRKSED
jgi:hypothetical protein